MLEKVNHKIELISPKIFPANAKWGMRRLEVRGQKSEDRGHFENQSKRVFRFLRIPVWLSSNDGARRFAFAGATGARGRDCFRGSG
jgi:hypothetical protein